MTTIAIVDYGIGNLRSAEKALQFVGADAFLTSDSARIAAAEAVVVPGVGNFGACMSALQAGGLAEVVRDCATSRKPFLGICVGMQMLFDGSDEAPRVPGLGVLKGNVKRLSDSERLPHIAWNTVAVSPDSRMFSGLGKNPWLYFVHSYAAVVTEESVTTHWTSYGHRFVCAVESGNVWATQFHPEKSGSVGLSLLENFVKAAS